MSTSTLPDILRWMQTGVDQMGGVNEGMIRNRWPPIDITETPDHLYIYVEIPGVISENVEVEFYNNVALIKGTKPTPSDGSPSHSTVQELKYGDFSRRIIMPISVTRRDSVIISSKRGVLKIAVDKTVEDQNRFVINVGEARNNDSETP